MLSTFLPVQFMTKYVDLAPSLHDTLSEVWEQSAVCPVTEQESAFLELQYHEHIVIVFII